MSPKQLFLDELNGMTKSYTVKVKVIEKRPPKTAGRSGVLYQTLILQDDKGFKMNAALFAEQIEGFKDVLEYNGVYMVANALIKATDQRWAPNTSQLNFQMTFGPETVVEPVEGQPSKIVLMFQPIATIPKTGDPETKFDVLGIVLYVEEQSRTVLLGQGRSNSVREVILMDHSIKQPMVLSLWNELGSSAHEQLSNIAGKFTIAGFTALRTSKHKGFSLTTTMSTTITHEPSGQAVQTLEIWMMNHQLMLIDFQQRVVEVRTPDMKRRITTLKTLRLKKADNTLQDERHWIKASLTGVRLERLHAYIGCSNCGKRVSTPLGKNHSCPNCLAKTAVASPRLTFRCEIDDGTDILAITAFTEDTEKLLRMPTEEIYKIKQEDDAEAFKAIATILEANPILIELGPKMTLSRTNVLQWVLRTVIVAESKNNDTKESHVTNSVKRKLEFLNPVEETLVSGIPPEDLHLQAVITDCITEAPIEETSANAEKIITSKQLPAITSPLAGDFVQEKSNLDPIEETLVSDKTDSTNGRVSAAETVDRPIKPNVKHDNHLDTNPSAGGSKRSRLNNP